jgi:hypothetical protein
VCRLKGHKQAKICGIIDEQRLIKYTERNKL